MNLHMASSKVPNLRWVFSAFAMGLTAILVLAARVQAQTPQAVTDDDVNRIASQLYCPVCENVTLDVCPTTACDRWRTAIRAKLEAGWSDQAIEDYFVEQYGARVIGTPPRIGLGWLLYAVAPASAIGLGVAAYFVLRRKPGNQAVTRNSAPVPTAEIKNWREKLDRDIHKDEPV